MWLRLILALILALVIAIAAGALYGSHRWQAATRELRTRLQAARRPITPATYDPRELEDLPPPVERYFRTVLTAGQPIVASVRIRHVGQLNLDESGEKWTRFSSDQLVITRRPGFDWDARIRMAPGIRAFVHDAYALGEGILHASLFGLITMARQQGESELAQGELMRFLGEAAWYPTALLPSQGVRWEATSDTSARAWLTDGAVTVTLEFHFDSDGLINRVHSAARYRTVAGKQVATPWEGRFWNYERRDGMLIPLDGEVAWLPPDSALPYWRGRITDISYEFAR